MYFKNLNDLTNDIHELIPQIPAGYDCVVGIPRSGMLVANVLAVKLNLPLADFDGFLEGRMLGLGERFDHLDPSVFLATPRKILIVEDSISTGTAMARARAKLQEVGPIHDITFAAVYVSKEGRSLCDFYAEVVPNPRRFEWNILSSHMISNYAFDMDGVLCVDPTEAQNDDGELYRDFMLNAKPLYLPQHKIGAIVTSRLEKFRPETEAWLQQHGIEYGHLHMLDLPSKEDRMRLKAAPSFKAETYKKGQFDLFIESDHGQATEIARLTGRFVYALDTVTMHGPGFVQAELVRKRRKLRHYLSYFTQPKLLIEKLWLKSVGRFVR